MKDTMTKSMFLKGFTQRDCKYHFTYAGKEALFDYLEKEEEDNEEQLIFNPVDLCKRYTECENFADFIEIFSVPNTAPYKTMEDIEENTIVIRIDDESFIVENF